MKAYTLKLPLRTISLMLQDIEPSSFEQEAIQAYKDLHGQLWELIQHWENLREMNRQRGLLEKELQEAYGELEAEIKKYGAIAGFFNETTSPFLEEEEYTLSLQDVNVRRDAYCEVVDRFSNSSKLVEEQYKAGIVLRESFETAFTKFNRHYFSTLISGDDIPQVDCFSLDRDLDNFRQFCENEMDLHDAYIDEWNAINADAESLNNKIVKLDAHMKYLSSSLTNMNRNDLNAKLN